MFKRPPILCLCWGLALASLGPCAVAADGERARLVQQRRLLGETFAVEERACAQRFAVTACVDELKLRRREALAPLRERELQIDAAEREQKAALRRAAIAAKRAAVASLPPASAAGQTELRVRQPLAAASSSRPAPRARDDAQDRAAQAEQRARQLQRSRDEATAAQRRVQQRVQQREDARSDRKSYPLPVPAAASAPQP